MTFKTLIVRSLRFHWRGHLGVLLGAAVGSAALIGALVVGDSVRLSLRELALQRLGWVDAAMAPADRFFTQELADRIRPKTDPALPEAEQEHGMVSAVMKLPGTAARQDGTARANRVNVFGVQSIFWGDTSRGRFGSMPDKSVVLNRALASHLNAQVGDGIVLRIHKPTALSREIPITPQSDSSVALRVQVFAIAETTEMGSFDLQASQTPPLNAFLRLDELDSAAGMDGKANVILAGRFWSRFWDNYRDLLHPVGTDESKWEKFRARVRQWLRWLGKKDLKKWRFATPEETTGHYNSDLVLHTQLADYQLEIRSITNLAMTEVRTGRIFIDPPVTSANLLWATNGSTHRPEFLGVRVIDPATGLPGPDPDFTNVTLILTYLVNQFRAGERFVPYSMVTAAGSPLTPPAMKDDEIIVNQWLADDMRLKSGDSLEVTYFLAESGANLIERTNRFRVHSVVPISGFHADRTLMPEFPGLAKAESTHDWDAGFPLVHKIRDEDEEYWKRFRGTPKAFVTLAAGQAMWGNRFGNLTAIRLRVPPESSADAFRARLQLEVSRNLDPPSGGL